MMIHGLEERHHEAERHHEERGNERGCATELRIYSGHAYVPMNQRTSTEVRSTPMEFTRAWLQRRGVYVQM